MAIKLKGRGVKDLMAWPLAEEIFGYINIKHRYIIGGILVSSLSTIFICNLKSKLSLFDKLSNHNVEVSINNYDNLIISEKYHYD